MTGNNDLRFRLRFLRRYQAMNLDAKIRYALRLIERGLEMAKRPIVAWSAGKDSMVMLHLIRQYRPNIDVMFNNTVVEFPETLRFVKRIRDEWSLNVHVSKPERGKGFWWCLEHHGYPLLGKRFFKRAQFYSEKQRKVMTSGARLSPQCCYRCKEKPARRMQKELGGDVLFLGILAEESQLRKFAWCDFGDVRWNKSERIWKIHPLSIWTEGDIWEYHRRFDLPICDLYAMGHKRNGCWPCGMDIAFKDNHLAILRRTHPKLWKFLMIDKGLGEELLKIKLALSDGQRNLFASSWSIEELLEQRPCFFDVL